MHRRSVGNAGSDLTRNCTAATDLGPCSTLPSTCGGDLPSGSERQPRGHVRPGMPAGSAARAKAAAVANRGTCPAVARRNAAPSDDRAPWLHPLADSGDRRRSRYATGDESSQHGVFTVPGRLGHAIRTAISQAPSRLSSWSSSSPQRACSTDRISDRSCTATPNRIGNTQMRRWIASRAAAWCKGWKALCGARPVRMPTRWRDSSARPPSRPWSFLAHSARLGFG